ARLGDGLLLVVADGVVPLHDGVPLAQRLGDLRVAPVAAHRLLDAVAEEVEERLPFAPVHGVSDRYDLVARMLGTDDGSAKPLLLAPSELSRLVLLALLSQPLGRSPDRHGRCRTVAPLELLTATAPARIIAPETATAKSTHDLMLTDVGQRSSAAHGQHKAPVRRCAPMGASRQL